MHSSPCDGQVILTFLIISKRFNPLVEKFTYWFGIKINTIQCLTHRPPDSPSLTINVVTSPYNQNLISIKLANVHLERVKKVSTLKGLRLEVESTCNGWCSRDTSHNLAYTLSDSKTNVMLVMTFCLNHGKESQVCRKYSNTPGQKYILGSSFQYISTPCCITSSATYFYKNLVRKFGDFSQQKYMVWQKSNETDFLLTMNFILFTNQGYPLQNSSLGQPHSNGGIVFIVWAVLEGFCWNTFKLVGYALLDIIQSTKMAPFQVVFEPGE